MVEIETGQPRTARNCLEQTKGVHSVAQLGTRLHALIDKSINDPAQLVRDALQAASIDSEVASVTANLEDVFVAATSLNNNTEEASHAA